MKNPTKTTRSPNVDLLLSRRLRRRANINSSLGHRLLFAEKCLGEYRKPHIYMYTFYVSRVYIAMLALGTA